MGSDEYEYAFDGKASRTRKYGKDIAAEIRLRVAYRRTGWMQDLTVCICHWA